MTLEQIGLKLIEVANDVKWLVKENKRINGTFQGHMKDSESFRHQVTRNTAWRWAYKFIFVGLFGILTFIACHIF